jgi:hypothetical protein
LIDPVPLWLIAALIIGASARITRFIALDTLGVNAIRKPVFNVLARTPKLQEYWDSLTGCVYCLGFWVTLLVSWSAYAWGEEDWWLAIAFVLTASMLVAWLVGLVGQATDL